MTTSNITACANGVPGVIIAINEFLKTQAEINVYGYFLTLLTFLFVSIFMCFTVRLAVKKLNLITGLKSILSQSAQGDTND